MTLRLVPRRRAGPGNRCSGSSTLTWLRLNLHGAGEAPVQSLSAGKRCRTPDEVRPSGGDALSSLRLALPLSVPSAVLSLRPHLACSISTSPMVDALMGEFNGRCGPTINSGHRSTLTCMAHRDDQRLEGGDVRHVVWDWNGTLFDDHVAVVAAINDALALLSLRPIDSERVPHPLHPAGRAVLRAGGRPSHRARRMADPRRGLPRQLSRLGGTARAGAGRLGGVGGGRGGRPHPVAAVDVAAPGPGGAGRAAGDRPLLPPSGWAARAWWRRQDRAPGGTPGRPGG